MNKIRAPLSFMLVLAISLFVLKPAFAAGDVIQNKNTMVEKGQHVETLVVFGHDAVVNGSVDDGVIVIDGNLSIQSSANINGLVLVLGGNIHQQAGANVTEDVMSFAFGHGIKFGFLLALILVVALWFARLALSLLFLILSAATGWLLKEKIKPFERSITENPIKLLIIGGLTSLILLAVESLLVISVIGIPVAIVLFVMPFVFFFIGLAAVSNQVGRFLAGHEKRTARKNLLLGVFLVVACINFPFLGGLLFLGLIWISLGLMVLWLNERFSKKKR